MEKLKIAMERIKSFCESLNWLMSN
jgi:hypothetical protein